MMTSIPLNRLFNGATKVCIVRSVAALAFGAMLTDGLARDPARPAARQAAPVSAQGAAGDRPDGGLSPANAASALDEQMPPKGRGNLLADGEIRYCLAQIIRIDAIRPLLDRYEKEEVEYFNELVADYNSRCANYRYRGDALESGKVTVEANRVQIESEARTAYLQHFGAGRKGAKSTNGPPPATTPKRASASAPTAATIPLTRPAPDLKKETTISNAPSTTVRTGPKPASQPPAALAEPHPPQTTAEPDNALTPLPKPKPAPSQPAKAESAPAAKPAEPPAEMATKPADEPQKKDTAVSKPTPAPTLPPQAQRPSAAPPAQVSQASPEPKRTPASDKPGSTPKPSPGLEGPISNAPATVAAPATHAKPESKAQTPADKSATTVQSPGLAPPATATQEAKKETPAIPTTPEAPPPAAEASKPTTAATSVKPEPDPKKDSTATPPAEHTPPAPASTAATASPPAAAALPKPDPEVKKDLPSTASTASNEPKPEQPATATAPSPAATQAATPDASAAKPAAPPPTIVAVAPSSTAADGTLERFAHDVEKAGSQVLTPPSGDKTKEGGATTQIEVRFAAGGFIRSIVVGESSGSPALDERALEIARGLRFPDVPENLRSRDFAVRFPIVFREQRS